MKIWIDIATPPQVLFMRPIINELQKRNIGLTITTRDFNETRWLADRYGLNHTVIGIHGGKTLVGKGMAILSRAIKLMNFGRQKGISLAVSHGSYSQAIAARWLHIPMVAFGDYEGQPANHIICRLATVIFVPDVFCKTNLFHYGASERKIQSYNGIKENIYLADFTPSPTFLEELAIPTENVIATLRPPSTVSAYHRFKNPLFDETLNYITSHTGTFVVLLPRGIDQYRKYSDLKLPNLLIPKTVLDGPDLIYHSDLVAGAGGTMNREATVLGTPVYTLFKGKMGSVDLHLIRAGKMVQIEDSEDILKIKIYKKDKSHFYQRHEDKDIVNEVVEMILNVKG